ncbi:hypothetical protein MVEN_00929700 [Mycena venus]|uniref:Uncharacterized protein n=1 Tax=Mycena venus TaxID=2733690 RepID=A0A8H6YA55_9AGAR|nr:hypothetical protein MVEN_00929700 [Mycena venus]
MTFPTTAQMKTHDTGSYRLRRTPLTCPSSPLLASLPYFLPFPTSCTLSRILSPSLLLPPLPRVLSLLSSLVPSLLRPSRPSPCSLSSSFLPTPSSRSRYPATVNPSVVSISNSYRMSEHELAGTSPRLTPHVADTFLTPTMKMMEATCFTFSGLGPQRVPMGLSADGNDTRHSLTPSLRGTMTAENVHSVRRHLSSYSSLQDQSYYNGHCS